jgi:cAMP-dependent protein kinase regulator
VRIYTSGRSYFAAFFGEAQARAMDDRINLVMIEKGWPIRLYGGGGSEERFERSAGIVERSQAFKGMLDELHGYITREAGAYFTRNAFKASYESLYWEEREIAQEYLMPGSAWAGGLALADLGKERGDAQSVVSSVARFWELSDEEATAFAARLKEERKHAGQVIIRQGDQGDKFYIIKSGNVEISVVGSSGRTDVLAVLSKGDYFGEIALVKKVPRTATATALSESSLLVLEKGDFELMMSQRINIAEKVDRLIENRGFLARLPLFSEFAPAQVAMAASRLVPERFHMGQDVITQGQMGDSFHIIKEGTLEVTVEREGSRRRVAELGPGEYFGEIALLLDVPRTASVTALSDSLVLKLRKEDFQGMLGEHLYFARSLEQASSRRISDTRHKTVR